MSQFYLYGPPSFALFLIIKEDGTEIAGLFQGSGDLRQYWHDNRYYSIYSGFHTNTPPTGWRFHREHESITYLFANRTKSFTWNQASHETGTLIYRGQDTTPHELGDFGLLLAPPAPSPDFSNLSSYTRFFQVPSCKFSSITNPDSILGTDTTEFVLPHNYTFTAPTGRKISSIKVVSA